MENENKIQKDQYNKFIDKIIQTKVIYTLIKEDEVAYCLSNVYDTEQGEQALVFSYWSEEKKAQLCQKEEWKDYKIIQISLAEFIEGWCLGMAQEGIIGGIDFDEQLFGYEATALELLNDLIVKIEKKRQKITFKAFSSVQDLKDYIEETQQL